MQLNAAKSMFVLRCCHDNAPMMIRCSPDIPPMKFNKIMTVGEKMKIKYILCRKNLHISKKSCTFADENR